MNPIATLPTDMPDLSALSTSFRPVVAEPPYTPVIAAEELQEGTGAIPLLGSPRLREIVRPGMNVVIAFTDATRPSPDRLLVGLLRRELEEAGLRPEEITLLCAVGLHRPMTDPEFHAKLGERNRHGVVTVNHTATEREELVEMGEIDGIPVIVNRRCARADMLIATGIVEPHQYAGFSGGAKTVVIGCGGEETIRRTHSAEMLDKPGTRLGKIEGNPFQSFIRQAGERIGLRYVLNAVLNREGEIIAAAAGNPGMVHDYLAGQAAEAGIVEIDHPVHIAVAGVPPAKGVNLYQASRAATYIPFTERTPLLPGGPIIIPAPLPEGEGEGKGERNFYEALSGAASPQELIERLRREGFPAGAQRAYILGRVLAEHPIIIAGAQCPDIVRACHMEGVPDMETALIRAEEIARRTFSLPPAEKPALLLIPNGLTTLVRLSEKKREEG